MRDHRAQPAGRHRGLDLAALRHVERAVMQRDREASSLMRHSSWKMLSAWLRVLTKTSVGLVALDQLVDLAERVMRRMPGPGQPLGGVEHGHVRRRAAFGHHQIGERRAVARDCGTRKRRRSSGSATVADRPTLVSVGREREQPREPERQQIAALAT